MLHDVGKLTIPVALLNKQGNLDEYEWEIVHRHPDEGARIAAPLMPWLGEWGRVIEQHHERFDGAGYPRQLAGDDICLGARIVAVADAYDVMTSVRSYQTSPKSAAEARRELAKESGSQFDPAIVRSFLNISIGRLRWVSGPLSWLAQIPFLSTITSAGSQVVASAGGAATVAAGAALGVLPVAPAAAGPASASAPGQVSLAAPAPAPTPSIGTQSAPAAGRSIVTAPPARATTTAPPPPTTINHPPTAGDDAASTQIRPSKPIKIAVTADDTDPDGNLDPATVTIVVPPLKGKANASSGSVNYVPNNDAEGVDSFVYKVCDAGGACDNATVTVTLTP
jgi:hypothetical protein